MSVGTLLRRTANSLRKRLLPPDSRVIVTLGKETAILHGEISILRGEIGILRGEIECLRAVQTSAVARGLHDRMGQLEILLTEHPKAASNGLTKIHFPSPAVS